MAPHKCEYCPASYDTPKLLQQHVMDTHTRKRWQCQAEGCKANPIYHRTQKRDIARHQEKSPSTPDGPELMNFRAIPPMRPNPQPVYFPEYMKISKEERVNLDQTWYARIEYYASVAEHPDPEHPEHETLSRRIGKKKKKGDPPTPAARPKSSRADTSLKSRTMAKTSDDTSRPAARPGSCEVGGRGEGGGGSIPMRGMGLMLVLLKYKKMEQSHQLV